MSKADTASQQVFFKFYLLCFNIFDLCLPTAFTNFSPCNNILRIIKCFSYLRQHQTKIAWKSNWKTLPDAQQVSCLCLIFFITSVTPVGIFFTKITNNNSFQFMMFMPHRQTQHYLIHNPKDIIYPTKSLSSATWSHKILSSLCSTLIADQLFFVYKIFKYARERNLADLFTVSCQG